MGLSAGVQQGLAEPSFPPGTTINGSFVVLLPADLAPSPNLFDPDKASPNSNPSTTTPFSIPTGYGNSKSSNNVEIKDNEAAEFATIINPQYCPIKVSVDVTTGRNISLSMELLGGSCSFLRKLPWVTLTSDAFTGCQLTLLSNNFPTGGPYNQTPVGTVQSNTVQLRANDLLPPAVDSLRASWQLSNCPEVSSADLLHLSG